MIASLLAYPFMCVQRARVGRGFSVHSPFAYRFITRVLRERCHYYCFRDELTDADERRLFRVANFLQPRTVAFVDDCPRARRAVALACPAAVEVADPALADLTYSLDSVPASFRALYVRASRERPADAMIFTNGRTLIALRRPTLPPQRFTLNF